MVVAPGQIINPTGIGGFGDNPQNRANGRWSKENSQAYCLNMFLSMTEEQLLKWLDENPPSVRTVAQVLAYTRVMQARNELPDYKEVIDRTEGRAVQPTDITTGGDKLGGLSEETLTRLDLMYAKNNTTDQADSE